MANTKSALKQWRASLRKRARNRPIRSAVRTYVATAEALIGSRQLETAPSATLRAIRALDEAAARRILHPNNASRKKSRLTKKLNAALGSAAAP